MLFIISLHNNSLIISLNKRFYDILYWLCSGKYECELFGSYVDILQEMMGKSSGGLPVVIVQYAKIKIFLGMGNYAGLWKHAFVFFSTFYDVCSLCACSLCL